MSRIHFEGKLKIQLSVPTVKFTYQGIRPPAYVCSGPRLMVGRVEQQRRTPSQSNCLSITRRLRSPGRRLCLSPPHDNCCDPQTILLSFPVITLIAWTHDTLVLSVGADSHRVSVCMSTFDVCSYFYLCHRILYQSVSAANLITRICVFPSAARHLRGISRPRL